MNDISKKHVEPNQKDDKEQYSNAFYVQEYDLWAYFLM